MPLKSGVEAMGKNISELVRSKAGKTRSKGYHTLAKNLGIPLKKAKQKQAIAIAYSKAKK